MDNADIINAVADGKTVICPLCNTPNDADSNFCIICGASMKPAAPKSAPAFAPVEEPAFAPVAESAAPAFTPVAEPAAPAFTPVAEKAPVVEAPVQQSQPEPLAAFAEGLPAWDIVPPQVVVRRR